MAENSEDDFNLDSLNDEELVEQTHDDLHNGLKDEVEESMQIDHERRIRLLPSLGTFL